MRVPPVPVIFALILSTPAASAGVIHVPGDYGTIQEAINAAQDDDLILVAPGTYVETINFLGKAIEVRSDGDADPLTVDLDVTNTIIDGNQAGSVVSFVNGETRDAIVMGFTIRNGLSDWGGGILCSDSSPTISVNTITQNQARLSGGGIDVWRGQPRIQGNLIARNSARATLGQAFGGGINLSEGGGRILDNTITENEAYGPDAGRGAGICVEKSPVVIERNVITGNVASYGGAGGIQALAPVSGLRILANLIERNVGSHGAGLFIAGSGSGSPHVSLNVIAGNQTTTAADAVGGGVLCAGSSPLFETNLIVENWSQNGGGGLSCLAGGDATLRDNTIAGNVASALAGGGLHVQGSSVTLENGILWGNRAPTGAQVCLENGAALSIDYSDVEGGPALVHVDGTSTLTWGAGMIDADPRFTDAPNGSFDLRATSPCVDTADPADRPGGHDVAGNPRLLDGDLDRGMVLDMGACEFDHVHLAASGDFTPGGRVTIETSGTAGLELLLFVGTTGGELMCDPYGSLFQTLCSPFLVIHWGQIPDTKSRTIPAVSTPLSICLQVLAYDAATMAGNFSNDLTLGIE